MSAGWFWNYVVKGEDCWDWIGPIHGHGYGACCYAGETHSAHRVMYALFNGTIPEGSFVFHTCDNKLCVNPEHLTLIKKSERAPKQSKGHEMDLRRGEASWNHILTEDDVRAIRLRYKTGARKGRRSKGDNRTTLSQLVNEYDVSYNTIRQVVQRITWKHVE